MDSFKVQVVKLVSESGVSETCCIWKLFWKMRLVTSGRLARSGSQLVQGCCARALITRAAAR